jgi:hypothetical protein
VPRSERPCVSRGVPIRWESAECFDCRGDYTGPRDCVDPTGRKLRPRVAIDVPRALMLRAQGMTFRDIALELGANMSTVLVALRRNGVVGRIAPKRTGGRAPAVDWSLVARMYEDGFELDDLMERFGLTRTAVHSGLVKWRSRRHAA